MSIEIEADIDQDSTIYEALYDQHFEGWSQKLEPHRKAVKLLSCKAKEILKECKLDRIVWFTNYPKHSEHYGFKRCRSVLMEYTEVESGRYNDGRCESFGERSSDDERTESTISSRDSGIRPRDESASDAINAGE